MNITVKFTKPEFAEIKSAGYDELERRCEDLSIESLTFDEDIQDLYSLYRAYHKLVKAQSEREDIDGIDQLIKGDTTT